MSKVTKGILSGCLALSLYNTGVAYNYAWMQEHFANATAHQRDHAINRTQEYDVMALEDVVKGLEVQENLYNPLYCIYTHKLFK